MENNLENLTIGACAKAAVHEETGSDPYSIDPMSDAPVG